MIVKTIPHITPRCKQIDNSMRLNHFVNQFALGESRSVLNLSYGTILLPEKVCDERENTKEEYIPEMN